MTPRNWRRDRKLSLAEMASALGLSGDNAAATYRRWEVGQSRCPDDKVLLMQEITGGKVTANDWLEVRVQRSSPSGKASSAQSSAASSDGEGGQ